RKTFPLVLDDLCAAAWAHLVVVAVPKREQDMTMLGNEDSDRAILLAAFLRIRAHGFQRGLQRHHRRRSRLREQSLEFGDVARLQPGFEVALVFVERHGKGCNEARALSERD